MAWFYCLLFLSVLSLPIYSFPFHFHNLQSFLFSLFSDFNTVNRGFTHDPKTFHNPMTFKPERFLGLEDRDPEPDPNTLSFGFGRRICPGRVLADTSVYLTIAQSLAVFNISKAVENGK